MKKKTKLGIATLSNRIECPECGQDGNSHIFDCPMGHKKQSIDLHIYVHQTNPNGAGGAGTFYTQCTCGQGVSSQCPVHKGNPHYEVTC